MNRNSNRRLNRYDRIAIAALIRWGVLCGGLGFGILAWAKAGEEALPPDLAPVMIGVVQRDAAPLYRVSAERGDYRAENPALGWAVRFGEEAVKVAPKGKHSVWGLRLRLAGFGTNEAKPVPAPRGRTVAGNRVSYDRGMLEEWYVNGPLGLEQGFTLKEPPVPGASALVLRLDAGEGWLATAEGKGVKLSSPQKMLYYGALHTMDARGRVLPGQMAVEDGKLVLRINVAGATYPVTIDPLLAETAKLTALDATAGSVVSGNAFGNSVALSARGTRALIGAGGVDCSTGDFCGAAYVFVRQGKTWVEQQKLTASDATNAAVFGNSVALSARGTRALIGARLADCSTGGFCGAAYVFVRQGKTWVEEQKLTASDATNAAVFGKSVALSARGTRALIGADGADCSTGFGCGAAYVFVRQGKTWVEQQKLTASDASDANAVFGNAFGTSVALSARGTRALIGADGVDCSTGFGCGAAYVFVRQGKTWVEQQKLTASDATAEAHFGGSVALSARGTRVFIGADGADCSTDDLCGAAYVFVRQGKTWVEQQKLTASDATGLNNFGTSVALSARGTRVLIGANGPDYSAGDFCGAAYVFVRQGEIWVEQQKFTASDATACHAGVSNAIDEFGGSVALSARGTRALMGARLADCGAGENCGAAYVFEE